MSKKIKVSLLILGLSGALFAPNCGAVLTPQKQAEATLKKLNPDQKMRLIRDQRARVEELISLAKQTEELAQSPEYSGLFLENLWEQHKKAIEVVKSGKAVWAYLKSETPA